MKVVRCRKHWTIVRTVFRSTQILGILVFSFQPARGFSGLSSTRFIKRSSPAALENAMRKSVLNSAAANADVAGSDRHRSRDDDDDDGGGGESSRRRHEQRRGLRYKIPYVESFEEQAARELWEDSDFRCARHVVDAIILSGNDDIDRDRNTEAHPILTPMKSATDDTASTSVSPSLTGYEDSFDLLYEGKRGSVIDPRGHHRGCDSDNRNRADVVVVRGTASIVDSPFALTEEENDGPAHHRKDKVSNFCLRVAYRGEDFCGWQTQLSNFEKPSVQRTLEEWLTELQNDGCSLASSSDASSGTKRERRARKLEARERARSTTAKSSRVDGGRRKNDDDDDDDGVPESRRRIIKWADLPVAGRTDSGVSAIGQLCRFRTHRKDLTARDVQCYIRDRARSASPGMARSLGVTDVTRVSRAFHPTFTTSCRAYAYLIDIGGDDDDDGALPPAGRSDVDDATTSGFLGSGNPERRVALLDAMLRKIEGTPLDYVGLSYGRVKTRDTICTLYHARARLVEHRRETTAFAVAGEQPPPKNDRSAAAVCIELVGDRFLRRMVRLLVEASVRLVAKTGENETGAIDDNDSDIHDDGALLELIRKRDRKLIGRPAPPGGLLFVGARVRSEL